MEDNIENYKSESGMIWHGKPTKTVKHTNNSIFAYFNMPYDPKNSDCIIEIWKKSERKFLGITLKSSVDVIAIFRIKIKNGR